MIWPDLENSYKCQSFVCMHNSKPLGYPAQWLMKKENSEYKTELGVFKEKRRPIWFKCSINAKEEYENLLQAVKACFEEVIALNEGASLTHGYYLQKESKEWGGLKDVTGCIQDKEMIHLCCAISSTVSEVEMSW